MYGLRPLLLLSSGRRGHSPHHHRDPCRARTLARHGRRRLQPRAPRHRHPHPARSCSGAAAERRAARPRLRVGADRDLTGTSVAGCHGVGRRRQRASPRPRTAQRRAARHLECQRGAARRCSRWSAIRRHLVESADPDRQARIARPPRALAPPPARRCERVARRCEAPRRGVPAALDRRGTRSRCRADGAGQGLPGARSERRGIRSLSSAAR